MCHPYMEFNFYLKNPVTALSVSKMHWFKMNKEWINVSTSFFVLLAIERSLPVRTTSNQNSFRWKSILKITFRGQVTLEYSLRKVFLQRQWIKEIQHVVLFLFFSFFFNVIHIEFRSVVLVKSFHLMVMQQTGSNGYGKNPLMLGEYLRNFSLIQALILFFSDFENLVQTGSYTSFLGSSKSILHSPHLGVNVDWLSL